MRRCSASIPERKAHLHPFRLVSPCDLRTGPLRKRLRRRTSEVKTFTSNSADRVMLSVDLLRRRDLKDPILFVLHFPNVEPTT